MSKGIADVTGITSEELLKNPARFAQCIDPVDRERVAAAYRAAAANGQEFELTYTIRTPDRENRLLLDKGRAIRQLPGQPAAIEGVLTDITDMKRTQDALAASEARYRDLVVQAAEGIVLYDSEGRFVFVNDSALALLGYSESELLECGIHVTYASASEFDNAPRMAAAAVGHILRYQRAMQRKDGSRFDAEISLKQLDNGLYQAMFHDITERRIHERKIARLMRLHRARSSINAAIMRATDRSQVLHDCCHIAVEQAGFDFGWIGLLDAGNGKLVGAAQASAPGATSTMSVPSEVCESIQDGLVAAALRDMKPAVDNDVTGACDVTIVRSLAIEAEQRSAIVLPLIVNDSAVGILAVYARDAGVFNEEEVDLLSALAEDIALGFEFLGKDEQVQFLSSYDSLTGLPNRQLFFQRMRQALDTAAKDGLDATLTLLDVDRFQMINESLGRMAGDQVIADIAERIKVEFGPNGNVARVDGDCFAVLLTAQRRDADAHHAGALRFRRALRPPIRTGMEELRVTATAGTAVFPHDGATPEVLFSNAEAALRAASVDGMETRFYSTDLNAQIPESLRLENRLRRALESDELVLWYQPKVDVATGEISGFEALMRWRDSENGLVPPGKFIPIMEKTGLILPAGRWALRQVAVDARRWSRTYRSAPRIAVNVSPHQLRQSDFQSCVIEAAAAARAAGVYLDLEITESAIMANVETIIPKLRAISEVGVQIHVDDFGTGYSSLAYISRLPIHALKIDRSFVSDMPAMNGSLSIVTSVVSLAHALQLEVVAEGVETDLQAKMLVDLGCDRIQGYLFGRPMPAEEVAGFLQDWNPPEIRKLLAAGDAPIDVRPGT
jgi:diguanylate cyclase (GGDEF)-like protein/PAS domain S-box-containing protein